MVVALTQKVEIRSHRFINECRPSIYFQ